jgi:hypothetical protein
MPSYHYSTEYGVFRITINDDTYIDQQTRSIVKIGKLLTVGGRNSCVFISIPDKQDTAHLTNLKTKDGGCEVNEKKISGLSTIGMVNLAFTIVKEVAPYIQYIKLSDESDFTCTFDDGITKVGISMILYEFILYQQTYYEKRFGAYLKEPIIRALYEERKKGFQGILPEHFSFNNPDLENILRPIYKQSTTWEDFFEKIKPMPNVCQILFPWYKFAIQKIFDDMSFERMTWIINLENNPKVFHVAYTITKTTYGGGKRNKTRKDTSSQYKYDIYNSSEPSNDRLSYEELYNLKYTTRK